MTRKGQVLRSLIEFGIENGLDELENYLNTSEKYLQKVKEDFEALLNERMARLGLTAEGRAQFLDSHSDVYWSYADTFPRIFRNSFIVTALLVLEYELGQICEWLKREQSILKSWNDLRGNMLKRAKRFFELAGLEVSYNNQIWQELTTII